MRDPHIERLLGGYATNTLTPAERESLFAAALNDQELFNALQDEEALRDLLSDPDSRQAISRALHQPVAQPKTPWFTRGWVWGVAGTAAATCAIVLVVSLSRTAYQPRVNVAELKSPEAVVVPQAPSKVPRAPAPKPIKRRAAPPPAAAPATELSKELGASAGAPALPQQESMSGRIAEVRTQAGRAGMPQMATPASLRESNVVALASAAAEIPYSLRKRGAEGQFTPAAPGELVQRGDAVQLVIRPALSGSLVLWEPGSSAGQISLNVTAGQEYTIPDSPIEVMGERQFRLMLTTAPPSRTFVSNIVIAPGKPLNGR